MMISNDQADSSKMDQTFSYNDQNKDNQFNKSSVDGKIQGFLDVEQNHNNQNQKNNTVASNQSGTLKITNKKKHVSKKLKHQPFITNFNTSLDPQNGFRSVAAIESQNSSRIKKDMLLETKGRYDSNYMKNLNNITNAGGLQQPPSSNQT